MKVLCVLHSSIGHINSIENVLSLLSKNGYEVNVGVYPSGIQILKTRGYGCHPIECEPFGLGYEDNLVAFEKFSYFKSLYLRLSFYLYNKRKKEIHTILNRFNPEIILIDLFYSTDIVLIYDWVSKNNCKVAYVNIMPSLDRSRTIPPINHSLIPISPEQVNEIWIKFNKLKIQKRFTQKMKYFGHDDLSMVRDKLSEIESLKKHSSVLWENTLRIKISNIPELLLVPKEFEFQPFTPQTNQHYIGFQFSERDEQQINPLFYKTIHEKLFQKKGNYSKMIYCSFGSIYGGFGQKVLSFLRELIIAMKNLPNYFLILSLKNELRQKIIFDNLPNIEILDFVPQLLVLKHADLFITHGGINSIKEAIYYEVPMLVYPIDPFFDQPGNAARVEYHKIGLRGDSIMDKASEVTRKITIIIGDHTYKNAIVAFKQINFRYSEEMFLRKFREITFSPSKESFDL